MNNPLISVVLCTYNGSSFIEEQLASIQNQTYTNLEIIISDDASSDNTNDLLKKYAEKDSRIRILKNQVNIGFNLNFQQACSLATGEIIAFSDQDDIWHPEKLERMMLLWQDEVQLVYCNSVRFSGKTPPANPKENPKYRRFEGTDSRKLSVFNTVSGHAMMIKRSLLQLTSFFLPGIFYDWHIAVAAACNGGVGYVKDVLVFQRVHESNRTVGGAFDHNNKKSKSLFNEMVENHVAAFQSIPNMPADHVQYFKMFFQLWSAARKKKFSWPLFFFLVKNRRLVFNYKRKRWGFFSYVKHSYRLARN